MARLSERLGLVEPRDVIQTDSLDEPTRVALWNSFVSVLGNLEKTATYNSSPHVALTRQIWIDHFEEPLDEFRHSVVVARAKETHLEREWIDALELVEFVAAHLPSDASERYVVWVTGDFERYLVGFRFIDGELVPVSDKVEIEAIAEAMSGSASGIGSGARTHLRRATQLLSNRNQPQYAKVIAESISAVESVVHELTGEKVLSSGLKKLDAKGTTTHAALLTAWDKLYGYTSDASGIRHGLVREEDATEPLAVYFLVSCSAFINLLLKQANLRDS